MCTPLRLACFALFLWSSPVLSQTPDDPVGMVHQMHSIAGEKAIDCGHVQPAADPKPSLKCARKAVKKKQAFVVQYDGNGIEGPTYTAFAGNGDGDVYWLHVDSYTCRDPLRFPDWCPYLVKCPKPVRFYYYFDTAGEPLGYDCVNPFPKKRD